MLAAGAHHGLIKSLTCEPPCQKHGHETGIREFWGETLRMGSYQQIPSNSMPVNSLAKGKDHFASRTEPAGVCCPPKEKALV